MYEIMGYSLNNSKGFQPFLEPVICQTEDEIEKFEKGLIEWLRIGDLSMILVYRREAK